MTSLGKTLMVQGTSSSAGKSFLVTGLCRLLTRRGMRVAPFKAQNMSNNAFVTIEGHEIGRAQAVQAHAARVRPHVDMNPVLLKPEADHRSHVIVMGRPYATLSAAGYEHAKEHIWSEVTGALDRLRREYELVIIEGAGSPAEINLKDRDIANMKVALHARSPVLIVGDIDRGGVFAHFFGTHELLDSNEQALVKGFVINRFRGDPSRLEPGLEQMESLTGVPVVGIVPWVYDHGIPEEDGVALDSVSRRGKQIAARIDVAILHFPCIANFDDFDPLEGEANVNVRYVADATSFGTPDLVILPGTKSTMADLAWLRERGLDLLIVRAAATGTAVLGVCGGYQMLGTTLEDAPGVEGAAGTHAVGLALLPSRTTFSTAKVTRQSVVPIVMSIGLLSGLEGAQLTGYEIHAGRTSGSSRAAMMNDDSEILGELDANGSVFGCYLHGLFHDVGFRRAFLKNVASRRGLAYEPSDIPDDDRAFDRLAGVLESWLDLPMLLSLVS